MRRSLERMRGLVPLVDQCQHRGATASVFSNDFSVQLKEDGDPHLIVPAWCLAHGASERVRASAPAQPSSASTVRCLRTTTPGLSGAGSPSRGERRRLLAAALHGVTFLRWIALVSSRHPIAMARESSHWLLITFLRGAVLRFKPACRGNSLTRCSMGEIELSNRADLACVTDSSGVGRVVDKPAGRPNGSKM